jgi:hypothetical protein
MRRLFGKAKDRAPAPTLDDAVGSVRAAAAAAQQQRQQRRGARHPSCTHASSCADAALRTLCAPRSWTSAAA